MDHCLLQAPRALLRLKTPRKYAHFAGRAGAVMDGGGPKACFDAGLCQVGFAVATNPCRSSESCAPPSLLNSPRLPLRIECGNSRSLSPPCLPFAEDAALTPQFERAADTRLQPSGCPRGDIDSTDQERSSTYSFEGECFRAQIVYRYQVSMCDHDGLLTKTIAPPTNHHLGALDPLSLQRETGRGLSVCRRENWRHGSRARPSPPHRASPNIGERERPTRHAGMISRAQPSHLCGGGRPTCRPLFSVLLLLLTRVWRRSLEEFQTDRSARPRGSRLSPRRKNAAIPDKRGTPLEVACVPRRKPSRIKQRSVPETDSGGTKHSFSSV